MQPKRWIERGAEISKLGSSSRERWRLFWLYIQSCWKYDQGKKLDFPKKINMIWRKSPFEFYVREKLDFEAAAHIFLDGEYQLEHFSEPKIVVDVGSNVGATVILFKLMWPGASILAVEPDPRNLEALRKNITQFGGDISVIDRAIHSENDEVLQFYQSKKGHMSSSLFQRSEDDEIKEVYTITLDCLLEQFGLEHIDLLKFDVEGSEYKMFQGFSHQENVTWMVGEVHKDLMPESVDVFMAQLEENFELIEGQDSLDDENNRKPVVLLRNRKSV